MIIVIIVVIFLVLLLIGKSSSGSSKYCPNAVEDDELSAQIHTFVSTGNPPASYYQKRIGNDPFHDQIYEVVRFCKENILQNYASAEQKGGIKEVFAGSFLYSWFPKSALGEQKVRFITNVYVAYTNFDVVGTEDKIGGRMLFDILEYDRDKSYARIAPNEYHKELGRLSHERYNVMEFANDAALAEIERAFNEYGLSVCFSSFNVEGLDYRGRMMYVYAYIK